MKTFFTFIGLCLLTLNSNAQESEPITIAKRNHYYQQDVRISVKTVKEIVKPNLLAYQTVKHGKSVRTWSLVLSGFSGAMIGSAIGGAENPGALIGGGCAGLVASGIFYFLGTKSIEKGINVYNSSLSMNTTPGSGGVKLGMTSHGIGLTYTF